ncbi:MAG: hypothetical protein IH812_05235 [Proteobacteria bacterium]|nr:hypothetical protein [Pseudomonadota bacterium]
MPRIDFQQLVEGLQDFRGFAESALGLGEFIEMKDIARVLPKQPPQTRFRLAGLVVGFGMGGDEASRRRVDRAERPADRRSAELGADADGRQGRAEGSRLGRADVEGGVLRSVFIDPSGAWLYRHNHG